MLRRREFLGVGAATGIGIAPAAAVSAAATKTGSGTGSEIGEPAVRSYRRLGNTGLEISDISFGSSRLSDPDLVHHALDRGVNYFDSAESYRGGSAEEAIGQALRGKRDRVYVTSKTRAGANESRNSMMKALEGSLRRLQTDYVDVYFMHAVNDVKRIKNEEWREFTELARQQGKIRFRGISGHGSRLVDSLNYAVDHDLADVILAAHNFGQDPDFLANLKHTFHFVALQQELPPVLKRARDKGIGVIAMKVLMGARLNDLRPYERDDGTFSQAAFRWVLRSEFADAALISMTSKESIDEYLGASGEAQVRAEDLRLLELYARMQEDRYCRHGCNICESSCPKEVAIAEVLRTRMYAVDYGDAQMARQDYRNLGSAADACIACADQSCANACPYGIPIPAYTRDAAARLG